MRAPRRPAALQGQPRALSPAGRLPPLGATRLPPGFSEVLVPGEGGDSEQRPCSAYHWGPARVVDDPSPPDGRSITVLAGTSPFAVEEAETVVVAGRPARLGRIHEGLAVELTLYGATGDHPYTLLAYGVSRDELRQAAEGLLPGSVAGDDRYPERPADGLPDGRHPMKIAEIDAGSVTLGPVGWLTGEAADEWSAAHGQPGGAPNGFVLVDDDPGTASVPLGRDVVVTSVWARYGQPPGYGELGACGLCLRAIGLTGTFGFIELFHRARPEDPAAHLRVSPYWVTITGGVVTRIDEQYIP